MGSLKPEFFQALISQLQVSCVYNWINHVFISFSAVQKYDLSYIHLQNASVCPAECKIDWFQDEQPPKHSPQQNKNKMQKTIKQSHSEWILVMWSKRQISHTVSMVKIYVNIENFLKLLTQLQNPQDNIINIAESRCFIPNYTKNTKFEPVINC